MMPSMTAAYAVLRPDQINDATPQMNVLQRVGGSIGTAVLAVVLQSGISDLAVPTPAGHRRRVRRHLLVGAGHQPRRARPDRAPDARRAPHPHRRRTPCRPTRPSSWRRWPHDRRRPRRRLRRAARRVRGADGRRAPAPRARPAPPGRALARPGARAVPARRAGGVDRRLPRQVRRRQPRLDDRDARPARARRLRHPPAQRDRPPPGARRADRRGPRAHGRQARALERASGRPRWSATARRSSSRPSA